ncbi:unnamed protein product, partial [Candidula unifasciata]
MAKDICYTVDVRPGEDKNKQTHKESIIVIGLPAKMTDVKGDHIEYSENLHRGHSKLLEQELSASEKTPHCQKKKRKVAVFSMKSFDTLLLNKWKTK